MSYPAKRQTADERREYARLAREEAREEALGRPIGTDSADPQPPAAQPARAPLLEPEPVLELPEGIAVRDDGGFTFEVVHELPSERRPGRAQNPRRAEISAFARTHKGRWIKYPPTPEDPYRHSSSVGSQARRGAAGFGPGLEAAVRQGELYIRYVGEGQ